MPKLLFLVTEDWAFCSHRLPPARAAIAAGYEVVVATRVNKHGAAILAEGFRLVKIGLHRKGYNPLRELRTIVEIVILYLRERPDVVHHVALKPVLYGSIAARIARCPSVVNALIGLGFIFSSDSFIARILRAFVTLAFRLLLNNGRSVLILQNPDDRKMMVAGNMVAPERVRLIRGSGVDVKRFLSTPEPAGTPVVMLPSRMLWDKGIGEFVEAARLVRTRGVIARFVLVGDSDAENPAAIPDAQLVSWRDSGIIEWWGWCEDMPATLAKANIVCLPSYREGLPKVLLEAAACGRALVATDAPGCREVVLHGDTGLRVPVRDAVSLAAAIQRLLDDSALRAAMGERGRRLVEAEFSESKVAEQTLAVYQEITDWRPN